MKTYDKLPSRTIRFVNENSDETVVLIGDAAKDFRTPHIGEHFELYEESRTNIVIEVYHDVPKNEITIYYDWYDNYNRLLECNQINEDAKTPEEDMSKYETNN